MNSTSANPPFLFCQLYSRNGSSKSAATGGGDLNASRSQLFSNPKVLRRLSFSISRKL